MSKKEERLQFPLDKFWVSEPYTKDGYISLGKFEENDIDKRVLSPGNGKVISKGEHTVVIEYYTRGKYIYMHIFPLEFMTAKEGDLIIKGSLIGKTKGPHLKVKCYLKQRTPKVINPMRELYLHTHQYNRSNIPNHTPKPIPKKIS